jgi:hypothetical protein
MSTTMSTSGCISYAVLRDYSLPGRMSSTSTSPCTASTRLPAAAALRQPCCAPRVLVPRLQRLYINYATRPGASARRAARHAGCRDARRRLLRLAQARRRLLRLRRASGCLGMSRGLSRGSSRRSSSTTSLTQARRRLLRLHRASRCLGTLRGSSRGSSRRSSSTTPPRAGSSSTTSPMRASGFPGTSRGSSRGSPHRSSSTTLPRASLSSTTSPPPRVRVPRHVARLVAPLVVDYSASRRASGYLGTSRGSSRRSSSTTPPCAGSSTTTSPPPRVRVPRHVARHVARLVTRLVAPLVVDYSASRRLVVDYSAPAARPGASACRAVHHATRRVACCAARCRLLCAPRLRLAATLALLQPRRAWRLLVSRQHWLYFEYTTHRHDVVFQLHRVDHSSRLIWRTAVTPPTTGRNQL